MNKDSTLTNLIFILIAGIGNLKRAYWQGTLIYFSTTLLIGVSLIYLGHRFIEPLYHPSQTMRTFAVLIYIAFAFFWDGTIFFGSKDKSKDVFSHDEDIHRK